MKIVNIRFILCYNSALEVVYDVKQHQRFVTVGVLRLQLACTSASIKPTAVIARFSYEDYYAFSVCKSVRHSEKKSKLKSSSSLCHHFIVSSINFNQFLHLTLNNRFIEIDQQMTIACLCEANRQAYALGQR